MKRHDGLFLFYVSILLASVVCFARGWDVFLAYCAGMTTGGLLVIYAGVTQKDK